MNTATAPQARMALAATDRDVPHAAAQNISAGFWRPEAGLSVMFDKIAQLRAVRQVAPDFAFANHIVFKTSSDIPEEPDKMLVLRPALSPNSRGCAILAGPGLPLSPDDRAWLAGCGTAILGHDFVPGTPYFVNGVLSGGQLTISDMWQCDTRIVGSRPILISVVSAGPEDLPVGFGPRLQRLAQGLGVHAGPVHFELLLTEAGDLKLVKFAPRLASTPLPELCTLADKTPQKGLLEAGYSVGFKTPVAQGRSALRCVADFSFLLPRQGTIRSVKPIDRTALRSAVRVFDTVRPGAEVQRTKDGLSYGLTLFLWSRNRAELRADIDDLHLIAAEEIFCYD